MRSMPRPARGPAPSVAVMSCEIGIRMIAPSTGPHSRPRPPTTAAIMGRMFQFTSRTWSGNTGERPEAVERAARREDRGHEAAGDHLVEPAVDADALGAVLIVAHRAEVEAPLRALDGAGAQQRERRRAGARGSRSPRPLPRPGNSIVSMPCTKLPPGATGMKRPLAAVDQLPGGADGLRDHPHRHGGDREVVAAEPGDRVGDRRADHHRDDHRAEQGEPGVPAEVDGQERGGVGAGREEDARARSRTAPPSRR